MRLGLPLKPDAAPGTLVYYKADSGVTFAGTVVSYFDDSVKVRWVHSGQVGMCPLRRVFRLIVTFAGPAWEGEGRIVFRW